MAEKNKILLVDDDVDILEQIKFELKKNNYEVVTAESQADAEKMLKDGIRPNLAILDLMMEHNDSGFNLAFKIKRIDNSIPVIIMTAVTSETGLEFDTTTKEERSWIKADVLLNKPVRAEQLLREVERLLNK